MFCMQTGTVADHCHPRVENRIAMISRRPGQKLLYAYVKTLVRRPTANKRAAVQRLRLCYKHNAIHLSFKRLFVLCANTAQFVCNPVGKQEDRACHDVVHLIQKAK